MPKPGDLPADAARLKAGRRGVKRGFSEGEALKNSHMQCGLFKLPFYGILMLANMPFMLFCLFPSICLSFALQAACSAFP